MQRSVSHAIVRHAYRRVHVNPSVALAERRRRPVEHAQRTAGTT
jgi:hypothetical protein